MKKPFACKERDELTNRLTKLLDEYANEVANLARIHGIGKAEELTMGKYKACVGVREALHSHVAFHGCGLVSKVMTQGAG